MRLTDFDLDRFTDAQEPVFVQVCRELAEGRKCSHWMWFVFPQLAGLGHSAMAQRYAIGSRAEAAAFLGHAVLGPRLVACTAQVLAVHNRSAHDIFGSPDDLEFHSCMTLFVQVPGAAPVFVATLDRFFAGQADAATLRLLNEAG